MKIIRTILYILLFGAFGVSLFVSYLYIKEHRPQPIPEELKQKMPETVNYSVNILSLDGDKIKVQNMENQQELEMLLTPETVYSKMYFGSNQPITATKEDIKEGHQATITALKNKETGELKVQYIEILIANTQGE